MTLKVFYLDDEPDLLEMFADLFAAPDVQIVTCSDVDEAVARLRAERFDVVFLDYRLPGITGDEIARRLPPGPTLAMITGDLNVRTDVPFTSIFPKPYRREELQQFLREQLRRKENRG